MDAKAAIGPVGHDVPLGTVHRVGHVTGHLAGRPGFGVAVLPHIADPPLGNDLAVVGEATFQMHLAEPGEVSQGDANAARRARRAERVDSHIGVELGAHGGP